MGNCFKSNKVLAEAMEEAERVTACSKLEEEPKVAADNHVVEEKKTIKKKEKKVVRFKLNEENYNNGDIHRGRRVQGQGGESNNGVVRIRLVVTQEELKQILSSKQDLKHSSMEQLIRVVKLRGVRVSETDDDDDDNGFHGGWRPALESIPEER